MLREAERQTPEIVRRDYARVYVGRCDAPATPRSVSSTTSACLEAFAAADAAAEAGVELVLLHVAHARGGIARFRQDTVADYLRQLRSCGTRYPRRRRTAFGARVPRGLAD